MGYNQATGQLIQGVNRKRISASFIRPSDTTAYTIGDVVGPVTTPAAQAFAAAGRGNGGTGKIIGVTLACNLATITLGTFRIHFFNTAITPAADNAVFTGVYQTSTSGLTSYQGYCDPPILVADAAGSTSGATRLTAGIDAAKGIPLGFQCAAGDSGLYAVIVALGAYVPSSAETFTMTIEVEQD